MSAIKELTKDFGCASERQIMDAFQEISNRLDALEKKAHYHSATNDHETCMHKHTCEIYNGVCEYKPDTERSCDEPAQEQLWICPKAKDCPCNEHILEKPSCNHVVPHKKSRLCESASSVCPECIPYAQEQGGDEVKQFFDFVDRTCDDILTIKKERDDLRARLEQAAKENAELKRQLNSEVKG